MEELMKAESLGRASGLPTDNLEGAEELKRILWGDLVAVAIVTFMVVGLTIWAVSGM
jgi:hypothetical protein